MRNHEPNHAKPGAKPCEIGRQTMRNCAPNHGITNAAAEQARWGRPALLASNNPTHPPTRATHPPPRRQHHRRARSPRNRREPAPTNRREPSPRDGSPRDGSPRDGPAHLGTPRISVNIWNLQGFTWVSWGLQIFALSGILRLRLPFRRRFAQHCGPFSGRRRGFCACGGSPPAPRSRVWRSPGALFGVARAPFGCL